MRWQTFQSIDGCVQIWSNDITSMVLHLVFSETLQTRRLPLDHRTCLDRQASSVGSTGRAISYNCSISSEKKTLNFLMKKRIQPLNHFSAYTVCFSGNYLQPFCFNNFNVFPFLFPSLSSCIVTCLEAKFKLSFVLFFFPHRGICKTEVRVTGIFCMTSILPKNRAWIKLPISSFCHYLVGVGFQLLFVIRFLYL